MAFPSNAEVWVWYRHDLSASCCHDIQELSWTLSGILVLGNHLHPVHEETWPWKSLKEECYPLHHCLPWLWHHLCHYGVGVLSARLRILVLPSGSVLLLMLATDFNLEMVENDCLINTVLPKWSWKELVPWSFSLCFPWRSALSPWRFSLKFPWRSPLSPWRSWSWKEADSML